MTVLLDTHALLWWLYGDRRVSRRARALLSEPGNTVLVSSASAWEVATKHRLGKLPSVSAFVTDMPHWIREARLTELPISLEHAQRAGSLPGAHRDPFDRMIAAQSLIEQVPVISRDSSLDDFGVERIW